MHQHNFFCLFCSCERFLINNNNLQVFIMQPYSSECVFVCEKRVFCDDGITQMEGK